MPGDARSQFPDLIPFTGGLSAGHVTWIEVPGATPALVPGMMPTDGPITTPVWLWIGMTGCCCRSPVAWFGRQMGRGAFQVLVSGRQVS